jgi:hypothetical protein
METLMTWIGPVLDVVAVVLLTAVLWRLGRDPGAASTAWGEREARLQTIFDDLRALVAQSEGLARDLDAKLAVREERLQALLGAAEAATRAETAASTRGAAAADAAAAAPLRANRVDVRDEARAAHDASQAESATVAARIEALADAGTAVEEIARRLGVAPAEVRLVIGLKGARVARQRVAAPERAHA